MKVHLMILSLFVGWAVAFGQDTFDLKKDFVKYDWATCDDDSTYAHSDTIYPYNNEYTYLAQGWCHELCWSMKKKRVSIIRTRLCQEPPISTVHFNWCDMHVKISKRKNVYAIQVGRGKGKHGKFEVVGVEDVVLDNGQKSLRLTLLRVYENPISL